ncbi:MAG TPA: glutamate--tRNA ligase [Verrucomicrobiales bacterium]|nr:glutamate--tRNA ligase [Verrucomicrobiales bacterium]
MSVQVRFAPSPTGLLHVGGARTALFNWLFARHHGGDFILRIEDTDEARNTAAAVQIIFDALRWLGLEWDEGPVSAGDPTASKGDRGPYFQSCRKEIYRRRIQELKDKGLAYERDGAVKFRMTREPVIIPDLVAGDVERKLTDREEADPDFVIVRSDGQPVFHLVNVIDDLEMGITHVVRGEDHLSNTSKHIQLFKAFGAEPPKFAHIPLILNPDGSKMSKRDTGASMGTYMDGFFLPEAVINYLCLLGWSPKDDSQLLKIEDVAARFDLPQILRGNARFDMGKLQWLNGEHLKTAAPERFHALCLRELGRGGVDVSGARPEYLAAVLETYREKYQQLIDAPASAAFYFTDDYVMDPEAAAGALNAEAAPLVERLIAELEKLPQFNADAIQALYKPLSKELGVKVGALVAPTRVALTGSKVGPSLYHLMEILGREKVCSRLRKALAGLGA